MLPKHSLLARNSFPTRVWDASVSLEDSKFFLLIPCNTEQINKIQVKQNSWFAMRVDCNLQKGEKHVLLCYPHISSHCGATAISLVMLQALPPLPEAGSPHYIPVSKLSMLPALPQHPFCLHTLCCLHMHACLQDIHCSITYSHIAELLSSVFRTVFRVSILRISEHQELPQEKHLLLTTKIQDWSTHLRQKPRYRQYNVPSEPLGLFLAKLLSAV